jgi:thiol-disulfide isomerase/thioredoxin
MASFLQRALADTLPTTDPGKGAMRKTGFALIALLFCLAARAEMKPGDVPPDGLGKTLDGQVVSLASMHGKIVVISFWATWCHYCMQEMPVLAEVQAQANMHHLPLQVVLVDAKESRDTFVRSARLIQHRLPGLLVSCDRDGKIGEPYGANKYIPVMVMLHRDGTVAHVHAGYDESMLDTLVAEINELLTEPDAAPAQVTPPPLPHATAATE